MLRHYPISNNVCYYACAKTVTPAHGAHTGAARSAHRSRRGAKPTNRSLQRSTPKKTAPPHAQPIRHSRRGLSAGARDRPDGAPFAAKAASQPCGARCREQSFSVGGRRRGWGDGCNWPCPSPAPRDWRRAWKQVDPNGGPSAHKVARFVTWLAPWPLRGTGTSSTSRPITLDPRARGGGRLAGWLASSPPTRQPLPLAELLLRQSGP